MSSVNAFNSDECQVSSFYRVKDFGQLRFRNAPNVPRNSLLVNPNPAVFNPFPKEKILDKIKLKAFADDKFSVTKMIISVFDRVEKTVGKGEIACISNFSISHNVLKASFPDLSKGVRIL